MIEHLSGEQISQWMIGDRSPQMERHVAECNDCRRQLEQLETTLSQFRGAMRNWSGPEPVPAWREPSRNAIWFTWPRAVLALAVFGLMVTLPVYWSARQRALAVEAAHADVLLLERVNSEISRGVPEPMEPLVNLVAWNSTPAEEKQKAERQ